MRTALLCLVSASVVMWVALLGGCASMHQTQDDVYMRLSGGRLEQWKSVRDASALHWPFAWAAVAAYQDADDPKRKPLTITSECPEPHAYLKTHGWELWEELPLLKTPPAPGSAAEEMLRAHLRAEVWSNATERKVIVAFGGTAATSWQDWKANLRWFLEWLPPADEYAVVTNTFVPEFASAWRVRSRDPKNEWMNSASVIATGHSLGAGLAERFAYALSPDRGVPEVKEVYGFDPSPVSGKRESKDWKKRANGLTIYRIYNRGEILATVRSTLMLVENPPEGQHQTWIDIRYRDNWTWRTLLPDGSVHAHGMFDLACFMKEKMETSAPEQPAAAATYSPNPDR